MDIFLSKKQEISILREYSEDLFGSGEDFPLSGASSSLNITSEDVRH